MGTLYFDPSLSTHSELLVTANIPALTDPQNIVDRCNLGFRGYLKIQLVSKLDRTSDVYLS